MKGTMHKTSRGWVVKQLIDQGPEAVFTRDYPLHPHDVEQIRQDSQRFDNIEARIAAYPDVEFEIVDFWEKGLKEAIKVAKLKQ